MAINPKKTGAGRRAAELFAANIPFYNSRGNHEGRGMFSYRYLDYFPTSTGETYYMVRQGPAAILVLDCGEDKPDNDIEYAGLADYDAYRAEECEWLKQAVESEAFLGASTRIVLLHVPPTLGTWHGNLQLKELFLPVLNEAGIDLMLCGHEHSYAYLPAGEGGAEFPILVNDNRSYVRCTVSAEKITLQVVGPEGAVSHTHEIEPKHNL